jgi:hypothetical protein
VPFTAPAAERRDDGPDAMRAQPRHAIRRARPRPLHHLRPAAATVGRKAAPVLSGAARVSLRSAPVVPRLARAGSKRVLRVPKIGLAWLVVHAARYWATLSPPRKRAHVMVGGSVTFAAIVLATSFPLTGLLAQRTALSTTAHGINTVEAQNRTLSAQAAALSNQAATDNLARQDYGFVPSGQRAFTILPPSSAAQARPSLGQVPLDEGPVVPGSTQSESLLGVTPVTSSTTGHARHAPRAGTVGEPRGYWARVIKTLEFWS